VLANRHLSLYLSGRRSAEYVDAVAVAQGHDGALDRLAPAVPEACALALAGTVERVHIDDLDVEDLLDRDLDLGLVGLRVDIEGVLVLVQQAVALLRDDGREENVTRVLEHQLSSFSASDASASASAFST